VSALVTDLTAQSGCSPNAAAIYEPYGYRTTIGSAIPALAGRRPPQPMLTTSEPDPRRVPSHCPLTSSRGWNMLVVAKRCKRVRRSATCLRTDRGAREAARPCATSLPVRMIEGVGVVAAQVGHARLDQVSPHQRLDPVSHLVVDQHRKYRLEYAISSSLKLEPKLFRRLIVRSVSNAEARRVVGINPRTRKRWRLGRTVTTLDGRRLHHSPVITNRKIEVSERRPGRSIVLLPGGRHTRRHGSTLETRGRLDHGSECALGARWN
jgi:hypothetical protein